MVSHGTRDRPGRRGPLDEDGSRTPARGLLLVHFGLYSVVVAALWLLGFVVGASAAQWAPWITLVWGVALALHVIVVVAGRRDLADPAYAQNYRDIGKRWGGL